MPIEIKELKIKAVVNNQHPLHTEPAKELSAMQLEKWKKEIISEALQKVKEFLKEQTER